MSFTGFLGNKATLTDKDGNVLGEFEVTSCYIIFDSRTGSKTYKFEGFEGGKLPITFKCSIGDIDLSISNIDNGCDEYCDDTCPHKSKIKSQCSHIWKKYVGFMESYDYCETCNEKKK